MVGEIGDMRTRKDVFKEYCPICWEAMERLKAKEKLLYICPICGMVTDGRRDNGHGKQLVDTVHKI